jgi:paraquat-inducible protein B
VKVQKPKKPSVSALKSANLNILVADLKGRLNESKQELREKDQALQELQKTLKYTKIHELEEQLRIYSTEIYRLKRLLLEELSRPKVSPEQLA